MSGRIKPLTFSGFLEAMKGKKQESDRMTKGGVHND